LDVLQVLVDHVVDMNGAARIFSRCQALQLHQVLSLLCRMPLLQVLVEDVVDMDGAARIFSRWSEVLACGAAAWPELTRRWVLLQEQEGLASPEGEADV
jgi:hypothetical protein